MNEEKPKQPAAGFYPRHWKQDSRPQRGWWAPGNYLNKCVKCGDDFIGDKRAGWCADCAYKWEAADDSAKAPVEEGGAFVLSEWVGAPGITVERKAALWRRLVELCREYDVTPRDVREAMEAERRTQNEGAPTDEAHRACGPEGVR